MTAREAAAGPWRGLARTHAELEREEAVLAAVMRIRFYPFVLERAEGRRLIDVDGNVYLDCVAGGAVMNVGYADERVRRAVLSAMAAEWSTTSAIFAHRAQTELAQRLAELGGGDVKVWFGTSGSEAMDTMARYFRRASGRTRLISFVGAFHGQTAGSGAISGMPSHDDLSDERVTKVPFPDPYRCPYGPCDRAGCSLRCTDPLRDALERHAGEVAGVVLEPIQSDGGDVVPPDNVLAAVRGLCDEHGTWLGVDEVKVGMGRTGRMLAHQRAGIRPDAIAVGKALGGGLPIAAVIGRREILDAETGTCAYTLAGSPIPCAAALATLDVVEDGLVEHAGTVGRRLLGTIAELTRGCDIVGDVRGRGLIIGVELVEDRASRRPARQLAGAVVYRCFELGLLVIFTGLAGNVIELTPPLTITDAEADEAAAILARAIDDVANGRFDDGKLAGFVGW
jgi:4-aminobutyrate aminotransferase